MRISDWSSDVCSSDLEMASVSDKPMVLTLSKVLLALGVLAADRAVLQELVVGHPERLVDLGDDLEGLVHQVAVRAFDDLGEEDVGDGVAPLVELHHAGRRLDLQLGEGRAEGLAAVGEVARKSAGEGKGGGIRVNQSG